MPSREARVIMLGDGQNFIDRFELGALAEMRRDHRVDDPVIEIVAGNGDPGMADWGRGDTVAAAFEAYQREIAGAAAEIANQHERVGLESLRVIISGSDGLIDVGRIEHAD